VTEEQNRAALLRALQEKIAAKEAAKKMGMVPQAGREPLASLPPELRILAQRRARFDSGDRSVHREIFGRQEQQICKGLDFDLD
jgi:hypothetical protein